MTEHSNTDDAETQPIEVPPPRSVSGHVSTSSPQAVTPVESERQADRIVVVGSRNWPFVTTVQEMLVQWRNAQPDKPDLVLVTDDTPVGVAAQAIWNHQKFRSETHPLSEQTFRRPEKERRRRMLGLPVRHAFVLMLGDDVEMTRWIDELDAARIPYTLVQLIGVAQHG